MTDTLQQQIIDGVVAALADVPGIAQPPEHSRTDPYSVAQSPGINVYALNDSPVQQTIEYILWALLVRIVIVARGTAPDNIANQFRNAVHQRIIALGAYDAFDTPGLVQYVSPSNVQFDFAPGDGDIGVVTCDYIFQYRTQYDDITAVSG